MNMNESVYTHTSKLNPGCTCTQFLIESEYACMECDILEGLWDDEPNHDEY